MKSGMEKAHRRLEEVHCALEGLAGMFIISTDQIPLKSKELIGLGHLLKILSREAERVETFLRYDSVENDFMDDDDEDDNDDKKE